MEEDLFEEILDECYPEVTVGCSTFSPSQVMKELDPTAFRIGAQENLDSLAEDGQLRSNLYKLMRQDFAKPIIKSITPNTLPALCHIGFSLVQRLSVFSIYANVFFERFFSAYIEISCSILICSVV